MSDIRRYIVVIYCIRAMSCTGGVNIGITPDQTTVKFWVYRGFGGCYSYSNMTNYFKMNNYCKFYCMTFIVTTAIMSDNRESQCYAVFYR